MISPDNKRGRCQDFLNKLLIDKINYYRPDLLLMGHVNSITDESFNIIKNAVTGIDISKLVCDTGIIKIDLKDDANNSMFDFTTSGCCLESVEESNTLDDNTTVSFSYYFPIIQ